jgi:TRAP-type C4-dicarboxylate transport system permease large subunit
LVPGVLAAVGYMLAVAIFVRRHPEEGPAGPRASFAEGITALRETWSIILIFALVIVGMYRGWFTPTEAAAVGAFGTGVLITPPVGMNVFVINGMAKDVPMIESFRGVLPFLISDVIRIAALIVFPIITLGFVRLLG